MQNRPTVTPVWRMRPSFRLHNHTTTAFNVVAPDSHDDIISAATRHYSLERDRRPMKDDAITDVDRVYDEPPATVIPCRKWETEWTRVAEVLDRFFFFVFMALLVIPTATILGIVRLFKPEL